MLGPAVEWLRVRPVGVYVDCTVGAGGHAVRIAQRLTQGRLIAIDRDLVAVAMARERLAGFPGVTVLHRNYGDLAGVLAQLGIAEADGILFDLGVSSMQLDDPQRGFSFQEEGPLDMRMDSTRRPSATQYLATVDEAELARVLKQYGDIRPSRRVAAAIVRRRRTAGLNTTKDLAAAVADALDFVHGVPEETRKAFQAIRIAVNDELHSLEAGMRQAIDVLAPEGRLVAITFHSGEDRIVKRILRGASQPRTQRYPDGRTRCVLSATLRLLTRRPVRPGEEELRANPRSHSAKLRAAERLAGPGDAS